MVSVPWWLVAIGASGFACFGFAVCALLRGGNAGEQEDARLGQYRDKDGTPHYR